MRSLTASEKRLSFIFLALIFAAVNFFVLQAAGGALRDMKRRLQEVQNQRKEQEAWLGQKEEWKARRAWLDAKQPALANAGQEGAALQQALSQSAQQHKLTMRSQQLLEPADTPSYREVAVQVEVGGSLESVLRWLAELQGPDRFLAVTHLTLKSDTDATKVICSVRVAKWFAPAAGPS